MQLHGKRTLVVAGLGVLTVAVTIASATLTILAYEGRSQEDTRQQALTQATQMVPDILSYDFNTVDDHFTSALAHLGGDFRTQFESVSKDIIIPSAKKRQVVTSATVVESSVVSSDTDAATVAALRDVLMARGGAAAEALARSRHVRMALNQTLVDESALLSEGCEVAFFPPVTGG